MLDTVVEGLHRNAGELVRGRCESEERTQVSGAGTILSNNLRAVVGQSDDPGMRETGTTRAVSPACRVLVLVTVRQATESLKWMLPLDKRCCGEKL